LQTAERGKQRAAGLLSGLAEALRQKTPDEVVPLLVPDAPPARSRQLYAMLTEACWLEVYKGYTADVEAVLSGIGWRSWQKPTLAVTLVGLNDLDERLEDQVELAHVKGTWYISDFSLARPIPGAALDPPKADMEQIRSLVRQTMDDLKEGRAGSIYDRLPKETRFRRPELSFWQKLTGADDKPVALLDDFTVVKRLHIRNWPRPEEFALAYMTAQRVVAIFDLVYDWPEAGIQEPDTLRIEITLARGPQGWSVYLVRLFGKAIRAT
jgi:hypothetical protein